MGGRDTIGMEAFVVELMKFLFKRLAVLNMSVSIVISLCSKLIFSLEWLLILLTLAVCGHAYLLY